MPFFELKNDKGKMRSFKYKLCVFKDKLIIWVQSHLSVQLRYKIFDTKIIVDKSK